ncbi:MAG: MMPL family transporter [Gammaproteobacteria bacterium]|nr:MMPL family transporter [Gammaproteobacteria bacterium]MDE0270931.1 MMPL family transporter [Gammaproteobacteria bacterium]
MIERWLILALAKWVSWVARHAWPVLAVLALLTCASAWVAVDRYRMNADLGDLIHQESSWRDDFDRFEAAFPDHVKTAVVVVSGSGFKQVEDAARQIEAEIRRRPDRFRAVYAGGSHPFFRDHALLYADADDVDEIAANLAEAQPWLTAVAEDPSLRGLLGLLEEGVENDPPSGFDNVVELFQESAAALLAGDDPSVHWANEFFSADGAWHRLIAVKSNLDVGETLANAEMVAELRAIVAEVGAPPEVRVGITGEAALAFEEIEAAVGGVQLAGWLAVLLLAAVLVVGVRSLKIIIATFAMLVVGISMTAAYAMLTVGEYNTLSVVFVVMFFGLGVDFAIHFSLRYQEAVNVGAGDVARALDSTIHSVGGAIFICTLTTSLGFLGFWPTDYEGLADLGIISAGGMVIAGFLALTLLPALFTVAGPIKRHVLPLPSGQRLVEALIAHRRWVLGLITAAALMALAVASQSRFDYSVLALKDPATDSMRTLRRLQRDGEATDYALLLLGKDAQALERIAALPEVDSIITLADFVPDDQLDKLYVLEDLQWMLASALAPLRQLDPPTERELQASVRSLLETIEASDGRGRFAGLEAALRELADGPAPQMLVWQQGVVASLVEELDWLRRALHVGEVTEAVVPADIRNRLTSESGERLSIVLPAEDVADVETMNRFIDAVQAISPAATGRPVIERGVGGVVVASFQQAMAFALTAIAIVLLVMLQSLRHAMLVLVPLALAVLFTLALGVLLDAPLNMANILVMPLIFGLGVDGGVHVVERYRGEGGVAHLMHSSTPRAVVLSALTTVGAFAALALSPHAGTASIGFLLAVAVSLLLAFTVFLLPVLLSWVSEPAPSVRSRPAA